MIKQGGKVPDWVFDGSAEEHMKGIDQRMQELAEEERRLEGEMCHRCQKGEIVKKRFMRGDVWGWEICCNNWACQETYDEIMD